VDIKKFPLTFNNPEKVVVNKTPDEDELSEIELIEKFPSIVIEED
jgi:hypothetical protein